MYDAFYTILVANACSLPLSTDEDEDAEGLCDEDVNDTVHNQDLYHISKLLDQVVGEGAVH